MLVRQKLSTILENNVFAEKWSPEFIFLNEKKKMKKFCCFLTSKVQFWHFLNRHSSTEFFKLVSFDYVELLILCSKILLFMDPPSLKFHNRTDIM